MTMKHGGMRSIRIGVGLAAVVLVTGLIFAVQAASPAAPAPQAAPVHAKLDINRATKAALAKLPGIGDDYAQKIIDGRPYATKEELESRKILPKDVYEAVAPLILARQK